MASAAEDESHLKMAQRTRCFHGEDTSRTGHLVNFEGHWHSDVERMLRVGALSHVPEVVLVGMVRSWSAPTNGKERDKKGV